ncbi:MAG: hypothetical protein IIW94_05330 [Clostridia bacterium]|nr:hypothetical protein [Clostridia bacterium]
MKNYLILFGLGAFSYGLLEVVWRGYSHWSMMIAGGLSFTVFSLISEKLKGIPFLYKCILGSLTVTAIELVFGSVFNLALGLDVWDYSNIPLNLFGQICLLFSVLWGFLCILAIPFSGFVIRILKKSEAVYEISAQNLGGNKS